MVEEVLVVEDVREGVAPKVEEEANLVEVV